jgi:hypothetical protein
MNSKKAAASIGIGLIPLAALTYLVTKNPVPKVVKPVAPITKPMTGYTELSSNPADYPKGPLRDFFTKLGKHKPSSRKVHKMPFANQLTMTGGAGTIGTTWNGIYTLAGNDSNGHPYYTGPAMVFYTGTLWVIAASMPFTGQGYAANAGSVATPPYNSNPFADAGNPVAYGAGANAILTAVSSSSSSSTSSSSSSGIPPYGVGSSIRHPRLRRHHINADAHKAFLKRLVNVPENK